MHKSVLDQITERVQDALNDKYHTDLCSCDRWPDDCVTWPGGRPAALFTTHADDVVPIAAPIIAGVVQDAIAAEAKRLRNLARASATAGRPEQKDGFLTRATAYEVMRLFARQLGEVEARPGVPEVPFAMVLRDGSLPDTMPRLTDDHVWVHPGLVHGRPCVAGTRLTVETVARYVRQDGVDAVRAAYPQLTRDRALVACWYAATHLGDPFRGWWADWTRVNESPLWTGEFDKVPDPPGEAAPGRAGVLDNGSRTGRPCPGCPHDLNWHTRAEMPASTQRCWIQGCECNRNSDGVLQPDLAGDLP